MRAEEENGILVGRWFDSPFWKLINLTGRRGWGEKHENGGERGGPWCLSGNKGDSGAENPVVCNGSKCIVINCSHVLCRQDYVMEVKIAE